MFTKFLKTNTMDSSISTISSRKALDAEAEKQLKDKVNYLDSLTELAYVSLPVTFLYRDIKYGPQKILQVNSSWDNAIWPELTCATSLLLLCTFRHFQRRSELRKIKEQMRKSSYLPLAVSEKGDEHGTFEQDTMEEKRKGGMTPQLAKRLVEWLFLVLVVVAIGYRAFFECKIGQGSAVLGYIPVASEYEHGELVPREFIGGFSYLSRRITKKELSDAYPELYAWRKEL